MAVNAKRRPGGGGAADAVGKISTAENNATASTGQDPRRAAADLRPDLDQVAAVAQFLDAWHHDGAPEATLVAIHPGTRAIQAATFDWPGRREALLGWAAAANVARNLYFAVNPTKRVGKKPAKADLIGLVALHADIDPLYGTAPLEAERERLLALADELRQRASAPSFIVDSGGGLQLFYRFEPIDADPAYVQQLEVLNARLEAALGGKGNHNADRIMRLPGTVNWPDQRKRDRGRTPAVATLLHGSGAIHDWPALEQAIAGLECNPPRHARPAAARLHVHDCRATLSEPAPEIFHWFARLSEERQLEEVERMLDHLTGPEFGEEYDLWLDIGFAVYRGTEGAGFEAWDRWCRQLPGYDHAENSYKWQSFAGDPSGASISVGTLVMHARQWGYEPPPWHDDSLCEVDTSFSLERLAEINARFGLGSLR